MPVGRENHHAAPQTPEHPVRPAVLGYGRAGRAVRICPDPSPARRRPRPRRTATPCCRATWPRTAPARPRAASFPCDPLRDFTPVGMIGATPNVLVVNASLPVSSISEFTQWLKKNPGRASYGSAGQGSLTHLTMELYKQATDTFAVHIPYRGVAPAPERAAGIRAQAWRQMPLRHQQRRVWRLSGSAGRVRPRPRTGARPAPPTSTRPRLARR